MREQPLLINGHWVSGVDTFEVRDPFDQSRVGTVAVASRGAGRRGGVGRPRCDAPRLAGSRASRRAPHGESAGRRAGGRFRRRAPRGGRQTDLGGPAGGVAERSSTLRIGRRGSAPAPLGGDRAVRRNFTRASVPLALYHRRNHFGVVAAITPFNFPLNLVLHKIAPALAAGCAVVLKPSERDSRCPRGCSSRP